MSATPFIFLLSGKVIKVALDVAAKVVTIVAGSLWCCSRGDYNKMTNKLTKRD